MAGLFARSAVILALAATMIATSTTDGEATARRRSSHHTAHNRHVSTHRLHRRHHRHRRPHLLPVSPDAPTAELVFDAETGRVLAVANPDQQVYPASLTKMMTLYLAFRAMEQGWLSGDASFMVSEHAAAAPPTKLGLRNGEYVLVEDLIRGAVTESANDAARVLAENLDRDYGARLLNLLRDDIAGLADDNADDDDPSDASDNAAEIASLNSLAASVALDGSEEDFARRMTLQARLLGMDDTTFRNASGLPDAAQVTTAPDMANLAYALVHMPPRYYQYFSIQYFDFRGRSHHNHNLRFLTGYDGADGIKTGYTRDGGFNVVDTARHGEQRLIAVVLGRRSHADRDADVRALLDAGFATNHASLPTPEGDAVVIGATLDFPEVTHVTLQARANAGPTLASATTGASTTNASVGVASPGLR